MTIQQICTFFLGDTHFGIEVDDVQEIIRQQALTPVPLAAPDICGLMNLRGQVVPIVDLSCRLGLRGATCGIEEDTVYNIIVDAEGDVVSFIVDGIGDVISCPIRNLEPPPATLDTHLRSCLKGAYKLINTSLLVLNTQRILDPALLRRRK